MMRAVITGPGHIELENAPEAMPGPHDLLVRPDAVGICGTDIELLQGTMAYLTNGFSAYPLVPGHEWTGLVTQVGSEVEGFAIGDRVVGECTIGCASCDRCLAGNYHLCRRRTETGIAGRDGALATCLVFPSSAAHRIPDDIPAADAALAEPLAVAYRAVQRCHARPGESLAVVGAGTIGLLCGFVARTQGLEDVTILEVEPGRREFAENLGFKVSIPEQSQQYPYVIDASGTPPGLAAAVGCCVDGGSVVLVGLTGAPSLPVDVDALVLRELTLRGSLGSSGVWPEVMALLATGRVHPASVVSHEFALADVAAAFDLAGSRKPGVRKVLVCPTRESHNA